MKLRHHDTTDQTPSQDTWSPAPGRVTRSELLPASGVAQHVQASPAPAPVEHEDPFAMHLIGASVQMRGGEASPDDVHAAAAHGIGGPGGALPHLEQIQASFGPEHDVSHVQAHVGGAAAEGSAAMGAQAYATGDHVAFANAPDLHTAAHEAAHVVQQRGGVQLQGGVGQAGDAYERNADAVADAVVRGAPAAPLLGSGGGSTAVQRTTVQRFAADEHARMGKEGSGDANVELAEGYRLPFGDVVALAGDHFSSIEQMRVFAKKLSGANSRMEIEYARHWQLGRDVAWNDSEPGAAEAKKSQESRYYKLAAGNSPNYGGNASHFPNPRDGDTERSTAEKATDFETRPDDQTDGSKGAEWTPQLGGVGAIASYRLNHTKAIIEAAQAGAKRLPIASALAADAFACHYLTDSFAGGHVRTERLAIKEFWDGKIPMFPTNLAGFMSQEIARYLRANQADVKLDVSAPLIDTPLPSIPIYPDADNFSESTITGEAYEKVIKTFRDQAFVSFGDVISGALHDKDNAEGVTAHVYGKKEVLRGDGHAYDKVKGDEPANNTAELATKAVALSVRDVYKAKELGAKKSPQEVIAELFDERQGLYPAEEFLPVMTKEDLADTRNKEIPWKVESVNELLRDPAMRQAIAKFLEEKGSEIQKLKTSFPGAEGNALDSLAERMKGDPDAVLLQVVHWTPGESQFPINRRRKANEYINDSKKVKGGFDSLTGAQRLSLIMDIMRGDENRDDVGRVWELLNGMDAREAQHVIPAIGWSKLKEYLGDRFAKSYPRDTFA